MMKKAFRVLLTGFIAILVTLPFIVSGAEYPSRPVQVINPQPPGGFLDIQSRTFCQLAEKRLGQPFALVNKPGAHGMIGAESVLQSTADGYTLIVGSVNMTGTITFEIAEGRKPPFTRNDFIPIGSFTLSPPIIIVPYNSPWKTLGDMIKDARAKPGHYAYSHGGLYGMAHVPAEVFAQVGGMKFRSVPYKGGGPAIAAVVGGHVDFQMSYPNTSFPLVQGNKLKVLGVLGSKRLKAIPDIPATKEFGVDAEYNAWVGILAPRKTPMPVVEKLRGVLQEVVKEKTFADAIKPTEVYPMDHQELATYWEREEAQLLKVMTVLVKEMRTK